MLWLAPHYTSYSYRYDMASPSPDTLATHEKCYDKAILQQDMLLLCYGEPSTRHIKLGKPTSRTLHYRYATATTTLIMLGYCDLSTRLSHPPSTLPPHCSLVLVDVASSLLFLPPSPPSLPPPASPLLLLLLGSCGCVSSSIMDEVSLLMLRAQSGRFGIIQRKTGRSHNEGEGTNVNTITLGLD